MIISPPLLDTCVGFGYGFTPPPFGGSILLFLSVLTFCFLSLFHRTLLDAVSLRYSYSLSATQPLSSWPELLVYSSLLLMSAFSPQILLIVLLPSFRFGLFRYLT